MGDFEIHADHLFGLRDALYRAAIAVRELDQNRRFDVETKGDNTPLTTADLAANSILRDELTRLDPNAAWLSEENEDDPALRLERERVWIVDPIDGTREFVDGTGEYSVSVGMSVGGAPDLGGVALPGENLLIVGGRGVGLRIWSYDAAGNFSEQPGALSQAGADIDSADRPESEAALRKARILVSKSETKRGAYADVAQDLNFVPAGSIARKMALCAIGRADLVISLYPKSEWDICGGAALLRCQAGAALIELESGLPHIFNQREPRTIGLAGGPAGLVRAFSDYRAAKALPLRHSYD
ncbi:MAG: hypothetical protein NXI24_13775 [bacterium]|nr:hypothetical protein [bacterium]